MTLKEKFDNAIWVNSNNEVVEKLIIIADGYAEDFGRWLRENDDEDLLVSELLEIFIKEKGL